MKIKKNDYPLKFFGERKDFEKHPANEKHINRSY